MDEYPDNKNFRILMQIERLEREVKYIKEEYLKGDNREALCWLGCYALMEKRLDLEYRRESYLLREYDEYSFFTNENIKKLEAFNDRVWNVQTFINSEIGRIKTEFNFFKEQAYKPLGNFVIRIEVNFYLDKNDQNCRDDDDNIIAVLEYTHRYKEYGCDAIESLCKNTNHNDYNTELPCGKLHMHYMLHELIDHACPQLTFADILRIGEISVKFSLDFYRFGL